MNHMNGGMPTSLKFRGGKRWEGLLCWRECNGVSKRVNIKWNPLLNRKVGAQDSSSSSCSDTGNSNGGAASSPIFEPFASMMIAVVAHFSFPNATLGKIFTITSCGGKVKFKIPFLKRRTTALQTCGDYYWPPKWPWKVKATLPAHIPIKIWQYNWQNIPRKWITLQPSTKSGRLIKIFQENEPLCHLRPHIYDPLTRVASPQVKRVPDPKWRYSPK